MISFIKPKLLRLSPEPHIDKQVRDHYQKDIDAKESVAIKALEERTAHHEKQSARSGSADSKWLSLVRTSGTAADKIAAATVLAQASLTTSLRSSVHPEQGQGDLHRACMWGLSRQGGEHCKQKIRLARPKYKCVVDK